MTIEEIVKGMLEKATIRGSDWGGSRLTCAQTCKRKHYYEHELVMPAGVGLTMKDSKLAPTKGTLAHVGLQTYYTLKMHNFHSELDNLDVIVIAIKTMLDAIPQFGLSDLQIPLLRDELISMMDQYVKRWQGEDIEVLGVEMPISLRIGDHVHTGIVDLFGRWQGSLYVIDHKTTSTALEFLFKKLLFDISLKGYAKALRETTGEKVDALINGIRFRGNKALDVEFEREPIMYSETEMAEFEPTVLSILDELRLCRENNFYPKSGAQCVQIWGECDYRRLCVYPDPAMVSAFYTPRKPNPKPAEGGA